MNCASGSRIPMKDVKDLSKKLNCTINDLFMSSTSAAFKAYFKMKGEKLGMLADSDKANYVNTFMPFNIRW